MRKDKIFYFCLLTLATAVLFFTGCKIKITVPEGGRVISKSGAYECESGHVCTIDINDPFFDEEFMGEPAPGYSFVEWRKVEKGLCANIAGHCRIFSAWAEFHEVFMELLESDAVFSLEPAFIVEREGNSFDGLTSQQLPIALTVHENAITHVEFTYQQLGEIPPDPLCQHDISVDLSAPVNADGTFAIEVSVPPQTSDSGKLQLVAFDGQLSGSLGDFEASGDWDFTELEILCEKSTGKTLRNFCGERFLPCIDAVDFRFDVDRAH
jgi:hypothetical protein